MRPVFGDSDFDFGFVCIWTASADFCHLHQFDFGVDFVVGTHDLSNPVH